MCASLFFFLNPAPSLPAGTLLREQTLPRALLPLLPLRPLPGGRALHQPGGRDRVQRLLLQRVLLQVRGLQQERDAR